MNTFASETVNVKNNGFKLAAKLSNNLFAKNAWDALKRYIKSRFTISFGKCWLTTPNRFYIKVEIGVAAA